MWLSAALLLTMVLTLDSSCSLYWATQVLEVYNSLTKFPSLNHK